MTEPTSDWPRSHRFTSLYASTYSRMKRSPRTAGSSSSREPIVPPVVSSAIRYCSAGKPYGFSIVVCRHDAHHDDDRDEGHGDADLPDDHGSPQAPELEARSARGGTLQMDLDSSTRDLQRRHNS